MNVNSWDSKYMCNSKLDLNALKVTAGYIPAADCVLNINNQTTKDKD